MPFLIFAFILSGVVYGFAIRTIRSTRDVPKMMAETVRDLAGYIVFIFTAAQGIALFTWTNRLLARLAVFVAPFWIAWMTILAVFFFLDLPVGPGVGVYIPGR